MDWEILIFNKDTLQISWLWIILLVPKAFIIVFWIIKIVWEWMDLLWEMSFIIVVGFCDVYAVYVCFITMQVFCNSLVDLKYHLVGILICFYLLVWRGWQSLVSFFVILCMYENNEMIMTFQYGIEFLIVILLLFYLCFIASIYKFIDKLIIIIQSN